MQDANSDVYQQHNCVMWFIFLRQESKIEKEFWTPKPKVKQEVFSSETKLNLKESTGNSWINNAKCETLHLWSPQVTLHKDKRF